MTGAVVGVTVGDADGISDPTSVGAVVGLTDGDTDGPSEPTMVGAPDAMIVGTAVVGPGVGERDGAKVGDMVEGATVPRTVWMAESTVTQTVNR